MHAPHAPRPRSLRKSATNRTAAAEGVLLGVIAIMAPRSGQGSVPDLAQLVYVPAALIGAACGLRLFHGLTDRQFGRAVNILLIAAGVGMMA